MAKRKPPLSTVVAFMSEENQDQVREQAGVSSPLSLFAIRPDPQQPRQLLPDDLATAVANGTLPPQTAIQTWRERAQAKDAPPALSHSWQELQRLADSIAQHGLINPISVRRVRDNASLPDGVKYLIVTGERRYWAHNLLCVEGKQIQEGVETQSPERIKATIASEGISIRAHQIIENLLREDIDAIEKANGFVALRQELSGREEGNHGSPLVSWRQVEQALGVSKRYRSYVTSVLGLSNEAQEVIRHNNLTERMVRPISQKLKDQPDLQMAALKQLILWQRENEAEDGKTRPLTTSVEDLVNRLLAKQQRQQMPPSITNNALDPTTLHRKAKPILRLLVNLTEAERLGLAESLLHRDGQATAVEDLQQLVEQLTMLLDTVEAQQSTRNAQE